MISFYVVCTRKKTSSAVTDVAEFFCLRKSRSEKRTRCRDRRQNERWKSF